MCCFDFVDTFVHDRFQLSVVQTMSDSEQQKTHLSIAKILQQNSTAQTTPAEVTQQFDIVNHFNAAIELVKEDSKLSIEVAQFNCLAAQAAKRAGSYATGLTYITHAQELLRLHIEHFEIKETTETQKNTENESWNDHYQLCFDSCLIRWELLFMLGRLDECENVLRYSSQHTLSLTDRVLVLLRLSLVYESRQDYQSAVNISVDALQHLGIHFPHSSAEANTRGPTVTELISEERQKFSILLNGRPVETLLELPAMSDPIQLLIIEAYNNLCPILFMMDPELGHYLYLLIVNQMIEYGLNGNCCYGLAVFGNDCSHLYGDPQLGVQLADLAIAIGVKFGHAVGEAKGMIIFVNEQPCLCLLNCFLIPRLFCFSFV